MNNKVIFFCRDVLSCKRKWQRILYENGTLECDVSPERMDKLVIISNAYLVLKDNDRMIGFIPSYVTRMQYNKDDNKLDLWIAFDNKDSICFTEARNFDAVIRAVGDTKWYNI
jgi:hypothetical protein